MCPLCRVLFSLFFFVFFAHLWGGLSSIQRTSFVSLSSMMSSSFCFLPLFISQRTTGIRCTPLFLSPLSFFFFFFFFFFFSFFFCFLLLFLFSFPLLPLPSYLLSLPSSASLTWKQNKEQRQKETRQRKEGRKTRKERRQRKKERERGRKERKKEKGRKERKRKKEKGSKAKNTEDNSFFFRRNNQRISGAPAHPKRRTTTGRSRTTRGRSRTMRVDHSKPHRKRSVYYTKNQETKSGRSRTTRR